MLTLTYPAPLRTYREQLEGVSYPELVTIAAAIGAAPGPDGCKSDVADCIIARCCALVAEGPRAVAAALALTLARATAERERAEADRRAMDADRKAGRADPRVARRPAPAPAPAKDQ